MYKMAYASIVCKYIIRNLMLCWDCANQIAAMMVYDIIIKYIATEIWKYCFGICFLNSMQILIENKNTRSYFQLYMKI